MLEKDELKRREKTPAKSKTVARLIQDKRGERRRMR
jgi:hypothetical protein